MTQISDREVGFRKGIRAAVAWLHAEADDMNDPHARALLNGAAFGLGCEFSPKLRKARAEMTDSGTPATLSKQTNVPNACSVENRTNQWEK